MLKFLIIMMCNWLTIFLTLPFMLAYLLLRLFGLKKLSDVLIVMMTGWWGYIVFASTGSRVEVVGLENVPKDMAFCLMANHQSTLDIPLVIGFIPRVVGFIAKKELKMMPIINVWMKAIHCVFIDRKNARQSLKSLDKALERIHSGDSLVIFPEGTRSKKKEMNPFKTGNMRMVIRNKAPILPVTIDGSYQILRESNRVHRAHVRFVIHPLIITEHLTSEEADALPQKLQDLIGSELTL